mgnify:CR=1 FL=1
MKPLRLEMLSLQLRLMLGRYINRLKNFLHKKEGGLPGGFFEKVVVDIFVKCFLHVGSEILRPLVARASREYSWRHEKIEKEKNILFKHLRNSDLKYNSAMEIFFYFVYLMADTDVPYRRDYISIIRTVQQDFPERREIDLFLPDLKEEFEPIHPSEKLTREKLEKMLYNHEEFEDELLEMIERYKDADS